jgi:hypothetical protein
MLSPAVSVLVNHTECAAQMSPGFKWLRLCAPVFTVIMTVPDAFRNGFPQTMSLNGRFGTKFVAPLPFQAETETDGYYPKWWIHRVLSAASRALPFLPHTLFLRPFLKRPTLADALGVSVTGYGRAMASAGGGISERNRRTRPIRRGEISGLMNPRPRHFVLSREV